MKQLITMEVIQWTALWNTFKDEFENEKNMLGGSLGDKAAEDLRLRVIEHVISEGLKFLLVDSVIMAPVNLVYAAVLHFALEFDVSLFKYSSLAEHPCRLKILLENNFEETGRFIVPQYPGACLIYCYSFKFYSCVVYNSYMFYFNFCGMWVPAITKPM